MYSTNQIGSVQDCDTLIALAGQEKKELLHRRLNHLHRQESYAGTTVAVNTELQVTQVEIAALTPILVSLPDGETREEYRRKIERLDSRLKVLNNRKADFGALALLQVEWEVARLDQEIEESDAFITALNARKAAL